MDGIKLKKGAVVREKMQKEKIIRKANYNGPPLGKEELRGFREIKFAS